MQQAQQQLLARPAAPPCQQAGALPGTPALGRPTSLLPMAPRSGSCLAQRAPSCLWAGSWRTLRLARATSTAATASPPGRGPQRQCLSSLIWQQQRPPELPLQRPAGQSRAMAVAPMPLLCRGSSQSETGRARSGETEGTGERAGEEGEGSAMLSASLASKLLCTHTHTRGSFFSFCLVLPLLLCLSPQLPPPSLRPPRRQPQ